MHLLMCMLFDNTFKERQDFTLAGGASPPATGYSGAPECPYFGREVQHSSALASDWLTCKSSDLAPSLEAASMHIT